MPYDFEGWATKANIKCSDGRTILPNAFADQDGARVPLVWNHDHSNPENILGHADLESRSGSVWAKCSFNNSRKAQDAKELLCHGDIEALSIYANRLQQTAKEPPCEVIHGIIREVSLVLAGANPGALISPVLAHGDEDGECAEIYHGEDEEFLIHKDKEDTEEEDVENEEKTIQDVVETMNEEQKQAMYALVGAALEQGKDSDTKKADDEPEKTATDEDKNDSEEEEKKTMKHNAFEGAETQQGAVLTHADQSEILANAKKQGNTLQSALKEYVSDNAMMHGDVENRADQVNGFVKESISTMFPDYKEHHGNNRYGELIEDDNAWFDVLTNGVQKVPYSRIRTSNVDLTELTNKKDMMARGYIKGNMKKLMGQISVVRRTTDPQTVYVKSALNRDDVVDITDFDYVAFQYNIDQKALKETLAIATLFGDGRQDDDPDKISTEHIRPIWTDDDTFVIRKDLDLEGMKATLQGTDTSKHFGDNYILAETMVETITNTMDDFRGNGTPKMFIAPKYLNAMSLSRDLNGRRMYDSVNDLKTQFGVSDILKVRQMVGKVRTDSKGTKHECVAIIVNPADYAYGMTKGGDISHFTDFDIDFNQLKSLIETRKSGALTRIKSAIVIEKVVSSTEASNSDL